MNKGSSTAVAIVGAGPYGVSIAAHLRAAGVDFRIFGSPISRWLRQMPKGMFLKSEWSASSLSDPARSFTLAQYCSAKGIPCQEAKSPVPLEVFSQYALAFQRNLVPGVEEVMVDRIERAGDWFQLRLANGESLRARKVVVATGLEHTEQVPVELADLPPELLSHSSAHHDLSRFQGKDVTVIGAGQSALETAVLLAEQGAGVRLLVRESSVAWHDVPKNGPPSLYRRLRSPASGLGAGLQLWAYCNVPQLFRYLPRPIRLERVKHVLGPAGAWWLKDRADRVPILLGHVVTAAEARRSGAILHVGRRDGRILHLTTDHVIAATGYRFDVERLRFLSSELKLLVRTEAGAPVLSPYFESSVSGLYFTGFASAPWFGPVMRFLVGADYTARRVCRHLAAGRLQWRSQPDLELAETARR